jgi:hypothetical protein
MGFLIVWLAVVASIGTLLVGWVFGPQAGMLTAIASPEAAALALVLVILLADAANFLRRRWRG